MICPAAQLPAFWMGAGCSSIFWAYDATMAVRQLPCKSAACLFGQLYGGEWSDPFVLEVFCKIGDERWISWKGQSALQGDQVPLPSPDSNILLTVLQQARPSLKCRSLHLSQSSSQPKLRLKIQNIALYSFCCTASETMPTHTRVC